MTTPDDRIRQLVDDARRRREQRAADRSAFAAARTAGLRRRHAAKLARLRTVDDNPDGDNA